MKIIAIANQKGGVGKTTTAVNLSACLARLGRRVLLVDLDQQVNATQHLGVPAPKPGRECESSYELLVSQKPDTRSLILPAGPNLSVIPGSIALAEVDLRLASQVNPDGRLKRALSQVENDYDYVLIDCPPSLGRATLNAFCAATHLIAVVETGWFAYEAVTRLAAVVEEVVEQSNPNLMVYALATKHRSTVKINQAVHKAIVEFFGAYTFSTTICHTTAFVEAAAAAQSIVDYSPGSKGHNEYKSLAEEVIQRAETQAARDTIAANK